MTPEQIAFFRRHLTAIGAIAATATDADVVAAATRAADEPSIRLPATDDAGRVAASIVPGTIDIPTRTIRTTILATERPVVMPDYDRGEYVDEVLLMSGFVPADGDRIPMLDSHRRWSIEDILGSMHTLRVVGDQLLSASEFSGTSPKGARSFDLVNEGHLRGVSVGYRVQSATYIPAGDKAVVNGREIANTSKRTLKIATRWTAVEGSPCAIGADSGCGFRSAANAPVPAPNLPAVKAPNPNNGVPTMTRDQLIAQLITRGYDATEAGRMADAILAQPEASRQAVLDAMPTRTAAPAPAPLPVPVDPAAAARLAEHSRHTGIRQAESQIVTLFPGLTATAVRSLTDAAIADVNGNGDSLLVAAARAAAASQTPVGQGRASIGTDASDNVREICTQVVLHRAGHRDANLATSNPAEHRRISEIINEHGGTRMIDLARQVLVAHGVSVRGLSPREIMGRAITHSTGDFTFALANVANKRLLAAYAMAPANWRRYCSVMPMNDFRAHDLVSVSQFGVMDAVPEGGTLPMGTFSDDKESLSLVSYKKGFSITREALINDDIRALATIPAGLGGSWGRTINRQAANALLANAAMRDTVALFHADHANLVTATAVTDKATAETAIRNMSIKLQQQRDRDGESFLGIMPKVLLCGTTESRYFLQAVGETNRADNNRAVDIAQYNLEVVTEPELENSGLTGYGTNLSYLFANPMQAEVVVVGFLNGNESPMLETRNGWDVDGAEFKVIGDAAVGVSDYRGAAKHVA